MDLFSGDTLIDLFSPVFVHHVCMLQLARQQGHLTSDGAILSDKNHCRITIRYSFDRYSLEEVL
jgi:hypothetical protein